MNEKWKQVSFFDISEIASEHLQDKVFYRWLFLFVDSRKHREFQEAWRFLKDKMVNYSDEPAIAPVVSSIVAAKPKARRLYKPVARRKVSQQIAK
jgi:hypothetical protein